MTDTNPDWVFDEECPECGEDTHLSAEVMVEDSEGPTYARVICGVGVMDGEITGCGHQWEWYRVESRFWSKVDRGDDGECWEWQAAQHQDGYGLFSIGGELHAAHRVAYADENSDPEDNLVLHHCDNPACVNPSHLYEGDESDNLEDMYDRDRRELPFGGDNPNAELSPDDVSHIKWKLENTDQTQGEIGKKHGVDSTTVSDISTGRTWSKVQPQKPKGEQE